MKQIHPNSLANLKIPKEKKKYGHRYALPEEKINELFTLISDGDPLREAAKKVNICYDTAKKYFEKGDSRRGIKPLKFRLQIFQDSVSKEYDKGLIERRTSFIKTVGKAIDQLAKKVEDETLTEKATVSQLATLMKLEITLRGGEITRRETRTFSAEDISAEDAFDSARNEEENNS